MTQAKAKTGEEVTPVVLVDHGHVAEALAAITAELPAISKKVHPGDIHYAYRGIEELTSVLQGLMAKHGVTFIPHATLLEVRDITKGGNPWTRTYLEVEYTIHGSAGKEDWIIGPKLIGVGDDNQDKGANKAETQAFKYALIQTFCVADPADDGDAIANDADDTPSAEGQRVRRTRRTRAQIAADEAAAGETAKDADKDAEPVVVPDAADPAQVADPETEQAPPPPEGWDTTANAVAAHNQLAKRIVALPQDFREPAMAYRKEHGWPLPLAKFNELEEVVGTAEGFSPAS